MAPFESSSISVSRRGSARGDADCTVVWVRGDHDLTTKVSLSVAVARAAKRDDAPILIDLSAVTFMDASTVAAIVGSRNRLRSRAQSLEVRAPSLPALRVLEQCGLAHLVRREPLGSGGAAAALSTWVEVPPLQRRRAADNGLAPVPARLGARHQVGALATPHGHVEEAATTAAVDRGGP